MREGIYLIFAIIPAVLWIYYFYTHDKGERDPLILLILAAMVGAAVVIPTALSEIFITKNILPLFIPQSKIAPITAHSQFTIFLIFNLALIAIIEEVFKFLAVRLTVYNSRHFSEIADGIVYMVAAALGFAAFENFLYFLNFGQKIIVARSIFTPFFHASASAIVGHYLALAKWDKSYSKKVYVALILAILLHFVYNFLVFSASFYGNYLYTILAIILLAISGRWMLQKFKETEDLDEEEKINL